MSVEMLQSAKELAEYFYSYSKLSASNFIRYKNKGVMVSTKVRKDFLTSELQGRICIAGTFYTVCFDNLGGGVYRAYIK